MNGQSWFTIQITNVFWLDEEYNHHIQIENPIEYIEFDL